MFYRLFQSILKIESLLLVPYIIPQKGICPSPCSWLVSTQRSLNEFVSVDNTQTLGQLEAVPICC